MKIEEGYAAIASEIEEGVGGFSQKEGRFDPF